MIRNGDKRNQVGSKFQGDSNSRDKLKPFPQGNGKGRAGEAELYSQDPFEKSGDIIRIGGGSFLSSSNPGHTMAEGKSPESRSAWEIPNRQLHEKHSVFFFLTIKKKVKKNFFLISP